MSINVSKDNNLSHLLDSSHRDRPKVHRSISSWNLSLVLSQLTKALSKPIKEALLKHLTFKTVFPLALGSGKRWSETLVSSRLDYCNSLFRSLSSLNMRKLQCIQNTLARIVTNCNKYTRASPILKRLHWLPVESRCIFKTATLVYKFLHSDHPSYFGPLLPTRCGRYSTRYNHPDKRFLEVPQFCPFVHKSKNHFGHSLTFDAPTVWNHLPNEVRSAPTLTCLRKRLKSYLFHKAFPP